MRRRQFLRLAVGAAALPACARLASAQAGAAGAHHRGLHLGVAVNIIARLIGQALWQRLGKPFVIENRPGAAGNMLPVS
jgi:tripartite-type tricarboxylate transporter receptor subunit TctC